MNTTPRRIEWSGPEGWIIWADEDGVHIRTPKGDGLEQPDAARLIDTYERVRREVTSGAVAAPKPPTPDERAAMSASRHAAYVAQQAAHAVRAQLDPYADSSVPF